MNKTYLYSASAFFLYICLLIASCKKKDPAPTQPTSVSDDGPPILGRHHLHEYTLNDIVNIGALVSESGSLGIYNTVSTCATVTILNSTITVDYGFHDCKCQDGKMRRGKLIYDFSGSTNSATSFRMPGFDLSVSADHYFVDEWYVDIKKKRVTNTSALSVIGQTVYTGSDLQWTDSSSVVLIIGSLTYPDTLTGVRTIKLLNSNDTSCYSGQGNSLRWNKARIQISGSDFAIMEDISTHIVLRYNITINNIVRDYKCFSSEGLFNNINPFISGKIYLVSGKTYGMDYGAGTCDPDFTYFNY